MVRERKDTRPVYNANEHYIALSERQATEDFVIPAKAGIQTDAETLDSRLRGNDAPPPSCNIQFVKRYKWRGVQNATRHKFAQKFGGQVFTIVSAEQGDVKRRANPEIVDEIRAEIGAASPFVNKSSTRRYEKSTAKRLAVLLVFANPERKRRACVTVWYSFKFSPSLTFWVRRMASRVTHHNFVRTMPTCRSNHIRWRRRFAPEQNCPADGFCVHAATF